jgi:predicted RNA binding protein YcfA (HicA-like mRNA interferase family)
MNWIIKFNQLEKEYTDKTLDIIAKFDKYKNDMLDDVYTKAYNLKYSIDNLIDKLNENIIVGEELRVEVEKLIHTHIELQDMHEDAVSEIKKYVYDCGMEVVEMKDNMLQITGRYIRSNKDALLLYKRIDVFSRKIINISDLLGMHSTDDNGIFKEVYWDIMTIKKIINTRNEEYDKKYELLEQLKRSERKDYSKIFDYKEMIDLAEKHEYEKVRQSGDHIIMQHKKTNKIVPIPAHELKYGLMLQIQKQIKTNKIS